jgi:hypothetical protein
LEGIFDSSANSIVPTEIRAFIRERLNNHWELFSTRIHITSFLLDHRFRDIPCALDLKKAETHQSTAKEFLQEYTLQNQNWITVQASWLKFREKQAPFDIVCFLKY